MSDSATDENALVEDKTDEHETKMAYQPGTHLPLYVVGIWACALVGLGIYFFMHYLGDLQKWGAP